MTGPMPLGQVFDWGFALEILPDLIREGLVLTIQLTLMGTAIALVVGLFIAVGRRSRLGVIHRPLDWFVEFVRSTPIVVQLFFLFFALPSLGIRLSAFTTGLLGLGLHYSTYMAEVYRAGIEGVPRGQWEAATALSFSWGDTWTRVVLPQAVPPVIPALGNYLISMFKDTPYVIVIGLTEIYGQAQGIGSQTFQYTEPLSLVGLLFLAVSYPSALFVRWLERRFGRPVAD